MNKDWTGNKATKICTICRIEKDIKCFYWHSSTNSYCSECKECTKARSKKYRRDNPGKIYEFRKKYRERRKEIRYESDRKSYLKHKYNIDEEKYKLMYNKRMGCCDICGKQVQYRKLCIDHNHKNNILRGMLCKNCNFALGLFEDNIIYLEKAIKYLKEYNINE